MNHDKSCWINNKNLVTYQMKVVMIKKAKGTKKCVLKRKLKFDNCKNCLEAT